jgi:hypothetical protein
VHIADRRLDRVGGSLAEAADRCVTHRLGDLADQRQLLLDAATGALRRQPQQRLLLADADAAGTTADYRGSMPIRSTDQVGALPNATDAGPRSAGCPVALNIAQVELVRPTKLPALRPAAPPSAARRPARRRPFRAPSPADKRHL